MRLRLFDLIEAMKRIETIKSAITCTLRGINV